MVDPRVELDPWAPPHNIAESHMLPLPRLLAVRIACGIILGVPATCLAPFALWLVVASVQQMLLDSSPFSVIVLAVASTGVAGFLCLWWFVVFGMQRGLSGIFQMAGIGLGALVMLVVIMIQLRAR